MFTKEIGIREVLKVLADDLNLKILSFLSVHGELCVCDLQSLTKANQSTVSRHLKDLEGSNLISVRKDGKWHYYSFGKAPGFVSEIVEMSIGEYGIRDVKFTPNTCGNG